MSRVAGVVLAACLGCVPSPHVRFPNFPAHAAASGLPAHCEALAGLGALGSTTRAIALCQGEGPLDFSRGGGRTLPVYYLLRFQDGFRMGAYSQRDLRGLLTPIRDRASALAFLQLWSDGALLEPHELGLQTRRWAWREVDTPFVATVREESDAFLIRWPRVRTFGCEHSLHIATFRVFRDGRVQALGVQMLARSQSNVCVD